MLRVLCAVLATLWFVPSASAAPRYASPTGTGTCGPADPCSLADAIVGAGTSDEIIVAPGTYPPGPGISSSKGLNVHGIPGQPRPLLPFRLQLDGAGSTVRRIELVTSDTGLSVRGANSVIDDVVARSTSPGANPACTLGATPGTLRNSICASANGPGARVEIDSFSPTTGSVVNVTAVGKTNGAIISSTGSGTVNVRNSIMRSGATGKDIYAFTAGSLGGESLALNLTYSNYASVAQTGANVTVTDDGTNQSTGPSFVDPGAQNYRQQPSSVTIDAGLSDAANGDVDIDGDPRPSGANTDIGADEFPIPTAVTGAARDVTATGATLVGTVSAGSASGEVRFEVGTTTAYGTVIGVGSVPANAAPREVTAPISVLAPGTIYHYRVVTAGTTTVAGEDRTFTTVTAAVPPAPIVPDVVAPVLSALRITPSTFRLSNGLTALDARAGRGTRISYSLSEAATVTLTVERVRRGRRRQGKCSTTARRGRRCRKFVRAVTLTRRSPAGNTTIAFSGRVGNGAIQRTLPRGTYRVTARAADPAGNASRAVRRSFKLVKR